MTTITLAGNRAVHMVMGSDALTSQMYISCEMAIKSL